VEEGGGERGGLSLDLTGFVSRVAPLRNLGGVDISFLRVASEIPGYPIQWMMR